jgi:uncharacterized protein
MKKEVKVMGLSYGQSSNNTFICVLSEKGGNKKIPIVISGTDANSIAIKIEGMKTTRPLTHDFIKNFAQAFSIDITECYIHNMLEGVFYAKITGVNLLGTEISVECSIGDAIAIALTNRCPIFVDDKVLELVGIEMDDNGVVSEEEQPKPGKSTMMSKEDLQKMMDNAIADEDYELAAQLRDKLNNYTESN